nr:hypothetical protein [Tanacetum cinerariifolium]
MRIEQYFLMTDYSLWEVILIGDSPAPTRVIEGVVQPVAPTTVEQRLARKNELKARGTLLMALPDKHQLKFNIHKDAKTLMVAIEKMFGGNKETKKILRSLPTEWMTHTLIWRNKTDLKEQSLDDLFNSLKIYEAEVKSSSSASTSIQNISFVSSSNTDSTNEPISAAASVSAVSAKIVVSAIPNIDADDLGEMDLKWQMAMLTVRARRFLQRTGRKLGANGPTSMGFDMSKVECYNCHRKEHFAREYRSPKDTRRNGAAEPQRRNVPVETSTSNALVSQCDGVGNYDWSFQAEKEPTNYALMAFTSLNSSYDNKVVSCSKACTQAYATLLSHYDKLTDDYRKSQFDVILYKTGLESVKAGLLVYQQNESVFEEDIKLLKLENLSELLASQTNDKTGLGYNTQVFTCSMFDCDDYLTFESDERLPPSPIYDRYQSGNGYHVVPPPYTGTFMPPKPDLVFHTAPNNVETVHTAFNVELSPTKPDNDLSYTYRPSAPIIEDWVSDSEDESETKIPQNVPSFVQSTEHVKSLRPSVKHVETSIPTANPTTAIPKPTGNGNRKNKKACFVGHHKQYAKMPLPNPQRHVVPTTVLPQSKLVPITAVRPLSTNVLKPTVTRPRQAKTVVIKPTSPPRRHINHSPSPKASNFPLKVTTAKAPMVNAAKGVQGKWEWKPKCPMFPAIQDNPQHALKDKGVIYSGCSMHMTGNMSYLFDFEELNSGYVASGRISKGGKISGKGKFDGKVHEGFLVGYSVSSKAFRVSNSRTRIIQETLHINFLENKPNVAGQFDAEKAGEENVQQYVLFPVWSSSSTNPHNTDGNDAFDEKEPEFEERKPESEVNVSLSSSAQSKKHDDKTKREAKGKSPVESLTGYTNLGTEFEDFLNNSINEDNTAGKSSYVDSSQLLDDPNMPELEDITYFDDEDDVGAEAGFINLETSITVSPIPTTKVHKDHPETQIIGDLSSATQTRRFEDPDYPDKVYKVVKAIYGLHQAPTSWYETLANYLLKNGFQRGKIDQTLFIKSQDKYVAEILRKFGLADRKSANTPIDTEKPLLKDPDGEDVDVHTYRSMIGSLMYLTSSRPDIMFAVCACACFQVTRKASHLHVVKGIFRYLKGKPHLGLWYPKDLPFNLVAYSNSNDAGASLDRKSTTRGCQFLGCRLISWQCKKQKVMATSLTEADPDQTVSGKDLSNPLMADNLPKIVWYSTHHVALMKSWLVQKQTALGQTATGKEISNSFMADTRNMIAFLTKSDASEGFNQIIDFLNASSIKYALTVNPNIYVSIINQFWSYVAIKKVNDMLRLQALVNRKKVIITEATIRDALCLDDAEGIECLPNEEIFTELARIGYEKPSTKLTFYKAFFSSQWKFLIHTILQCMSAKRTSWNEFSSSMESAIICLSIDRKINFSKYIFDSLVRNVGAASVANDEVPAAIDEPSIPSPPPPTQPQLTSQDIPSTSQVQPTPPPSPIDQPPSPQHQPQPSQDAGISMDLLQNLLDTCITLTRRGRIIADKDVTLKDVAAAAKDVQDVEIKESSDVQGGKQNHKHKSIRLTLNMLTSTTIIDAPQLTIVAAPTLTTAPKAELNKNIDWDGVIDHVQKKEKEDNAVKRYQTLKRKPQTEAQARKNMMIYLRNVAGFKKGMTYDDIRLIFEKKFKSNVVFLQKTKEHMQEEDSRALKRLMPNNEDDVYTEATPLARKVPVVDYEIYTENNKPYYKIIRADGSPQLFLSFLSLLRNFNREDLEVLWELVKERFASSKPKNFSDDFLLTTLTYMFEKPDVQAQV